MLQSDVKVQASIQRQTSRLLGHSCANCTVRRWVMVVKNLLFVIQSGLACSVARKKYSNFRKKARNFASEHDPAF